MMASPSHKNSEVSDRVDGLSTSNGGPASSSMTTSSSSSATYSAPSAVGGVSNQSTAMGSLDTNSQSHHFNIDSYDFGADFSLPTSLDELTLFHQQQHRSNHNGTRSLNGPPSSDGMASSPRNVNFSPRQFIPDQQLLSGGSGSRTQSPHPLSTQVNDVASGSHANFEEADLQNLLRAVQNTSQSSQPMQQNEQQQPASNLNSLEGSNLSLTDLERYLSEKEQTERMQILQTALLRQQLDFLQRQQTSQPGEISQPPSLNINAAHLMHQLQQLTSQQNSSTPTPQNNLSSPYLQQTQQHSFSDASSNPSAYSSQKIDLHSLTQYGLITPLSSGAFVNAHQTSQAFVSPIHMPSGSHSGLMDAHRGFDASFTPLESPAITPASVFSNIGSGNTTATSQDLFSPLTSPALRPHVGNVSEDMMLPPASPYHGPVMPRGRAKGRGSKASPLVGPQGKSNVTTPGVSPAVGPTKSVPRKNRSTTAEARANRARPSPLIKPTTGSTAAAMTAINRKRDSASTNVLASPLGTSYIHGTTSPRKAIHSRKSSQSEDGRSQTAFPPLHAGTGSTKRMDASPSERGTSSTPSPIDLNVSSSGKPMTPASMMGIDAKDAQKVKARSSENGKLVSFASPQQADGVGSPGALQSILPGEMPTADREAWTSMKSGGGGGLDSRRTSHKAAEQKRRDSLKYCFDELRGLLPAITLDDDAPGGSSLGPDGFLEDQDEESFSIEEVGDAESARLANRAISKVALLRHSNEYLIRLKNRLERRERDLDFCRKQVFELRARLGYPMESQEGGILAQYMPMNMDVNHFNHNITSQQDYSAVNNNHMDIS